MSRLDIDMNQLRQVDDAWAVVFESYRRRVPLLERKVGTPVNPEGTDLWVLCFDEDEARGILRYGAFGINEYVTADRRHTFERHLARLPDNAAVIFSKKRGDDHAFMASCHPEIERSGQRFVWSKGTYSLDAETTEFDRYVTRTARVGRHDLSSEDFHAKAIAVSRRLAKKAPRPFDVEPQDIVVSSAAAELLSHLTAPAATRFRHWLDHAGRADGDKRIVLSVGCFASDTAPGVDAMVIEHGVGRFRSRIVYSHGVLNDLGLRLPGRLPDSVMHGSVGMPIDRIVDASGLGAWPVREVTLDEKGSFFGLDIPAVPLTPPAGMPPLPDDVARDRLARLLSRDLRTVKCLASILGEMDANGVRDPSEPWLLKGGLDVVGVLSALGPETAAHVLEELCSPEASRPVDLSPWLGQGQIERNIDQLSIRNAACIPLAQTSLMPSETTP